MWYLPFASLHHEYHKAIFSNDTTILLYWLYWFFWFWVSLITQNSKFTYLEYIIYIHYFFNLFSVLMFFLHCDINILRQMKKLLYIWWIDYSITLPISSCDSKSKGNIKSILLFLESFLEKIVFGPLVFLSGA